MMPVVLLAARNSDARSTGVGSSSLLPNSPMACPGARMAADPLPGKTVTLAILFTGMADRPGQADDKRDRVDHADHRSLLSRTVDADAPRRIFRSRGTATENAVAPVCCVAHGHGMASSRLGQRPGLCPSSHEAIRFSPRAGPAAKSPLTTKS